MAPTGQRVVRVRVLPGTVALVLAAFVVSVVVSGVFGAAHQALGWLVAASTVALLLAPLVTLLQRRMRRALAIGLVLVALAAFLGLVGYGLFRDLSAQLRRLERAVPQAAARIEADPRLGQVARDFQLQERAQSAVDGLGARLTGEAQATARSVGAWFAGTVLVIFVLTWETRFLAGALAQIDDLDRRARARRLVLESLRRWRGYVTAALGQGLVAGLVTFGACRLAGVPAPVPLALWVGLWTLVPYVGVVVGALPVLLLAAGLTSVREAGVLLAVFLVLQVLQVRVQHEVHRRTLYVGPGTVLVAGLVGYAVYAIGGALAGIGLVVLALAAVDAAAGEEGELEAEALDPTLARPAVAAPPAGDGGQGTGPVGAPPPGPAS